MPGSVCFTRPVGLPGKRINSDCQNQFEMQTDSNPDNKDTESPDHSQRLFQEAFEDLAIEARGSKWEDIRTALLAAPDHNSRLLRLGFLVVATTVTIGVFVYRPFLDGLAGVGIATPTIVESETADIETISVQTIPKTKTPAPPPTATYTKVSAFASPTTTPTRVGVVVGCVLPAQLRVRAGPGTDTALMGGILVGDCYEFTLRAEPEDGTWVGFVFGEELGWVKAEYIEFDGQPEILELAGDD